MSFRIVAAAAGGRDQLVREPWTPPTPGAGELRMRHAAIGVNFIDVYHRKGLYPRPLPIALGSEAAGIVEAVGDDVTGFAVGDRVAYLDSGRGTYATHGIAASARTVIVPDGISLDVAAASLLKGTTVEILIERCARVRAGQTALVHAAAGGVGTLMIAWLKSIGAQVIAHASTADKAAKARSIGADLALHCPLDALVGEVRNWTAGHGVDHVFDGVGAASWAASIGAVAKRGLIVSYGNASGPVPPVAPLDLLRAGSVFLTRPSAYDYLETAEDMHGSAARLFDQIATGAITVHIGTRLPLDQVAEAHRRLESRETTGAIVLTP